MMKRSGMRRLAAFAAAAALVLCLVGCGGAQSTAQGNTEPVDLSVWTYYNGDQLESFNKLVDTFNDTVGKEKNITVESYSQGSVNDLEALDGLLALLLLGVLVSDDGCGTGQGGRFCHAQHLYGLCRHRLCHGPDGRAG